jgi:hypothetical protein
MFVINLNSLKVLLTTTHFKRLFPRQNNSSTQKKKKKEKRNGTFGNEV